MTYGATRLELSRISFLKIAKNLRIDSRRQPGGLQESSRLPETTGKVDNGSQPERVPSPRDIQTIFRTPSGCKLFIIDYGGLRYAPTTGYFLATLTGCIHVNQPIWFTAMK